MRFRVVYWWEHQYDASFDEMREVVVDAASEDEAVRAFRSEHGDVSVQSVVRV